MSDDKKMSKEEKKELVKEIIKMCIGLFVIFLLFVAGSYFYYKTFLFPRIE